MTPTNNKRGLAAIVGSVAAAALLVLTPHFEGEKLSTYRDIGGVLSYCDGATENAQWGKTYTPEQCRAQLDNDLERHAVGVMGCIHAPMTNGQKIAYVDFAYNEGVTAFCDSGMARLTNSGKPRDGCAWLLQYDGINVPVLDENKRPVRDANGRVIKKHVIVKGLALRRAAERKICEEGL